MQVILLLLSIIFTSKSSTLPYKMEEMTPKKIQEAVLKYEIVPDVIDVAPKHVMKAHWLHGIAAKFGNLMIPEDLRLSPFLVTWPSKEGLMYTLIMIGPDEPSREYHSLREWNHWIVGNMPGPLLLTGDVLAEYVGPDPLEGTGVHRYIFLVYEQPGNITFHEPILNVHRNDSQRGRFSAREFAKKYRLGDPFAANFFIADWKKNSSTGIDEYGYDAFKIDDNIPFKFPFDADDNDENDS